MKAVVVFESMWGNTEQVAHAIAKGLRDGHQVEVVDVGEATPEVVDGADLLVVGGPTHAFSMSRQTTRDDAVNRGAPWDRAQRGIREWLDDLPEGDIAVATFDTRVGRGKHLPGSAAKKAAKEVRRHHLGRLVESESFWCEDMEGPLLDGELERAEAWGRSLRHTLAPAAH